MTYNVLKLPGFPEYEIFASLYKGVTNHKAIRNEIGSSSSKVDLDFAFVNAENILCMEQLYSALFRCFVDKKNGDMKARTIHTEIISDLSPLRNIMEALGKFGIPSKGDKSNIIALKILGSSDPSDTGSLDKIAKGLDDLFENDGIGGVYLTDANLESTSDIGKICKNYKLGDLHAEDNDKLTRLVVDIIQLRGI